MRYKIILSYNGATFSGWQIQNNAETVQGTLEKALTTLLRQRIEVVGAGRTDTGVNAINYVAHFDAPEILDTAALVCKLNAITPTGIAVCSAERAADDFHARFSAISRRYEYFIHSKKDPFIDKFSWHCRYRLDLERMQRACELLPGVHDCSCFEKKGSDNTTSICDIKYARWDEITSPSGTRQLHFTIEANRFLRNMVRAVVGTMVDIGRGVREPEYITTLLSGGSRSDAGQSVPAHGLFLTKVEYPPHGNQKI